MKEAPNIITNKDLLYIKDMLNWNLIMNKKIFNYLDLINDEKIKKLLNKVLKMHNNHYCELLNICN